MLRISILSLFSAFFLSGCIQTQRTVYITPELVQYSPDEQAEVADELDACADVSMIV